MFRFVALIPMLFAPPAVGSGLGCAIGVGDASASRVNSSACIAWLGRLLVTRVYLLTARWLKSAVTNFALTLTISNPDPSGTRCLTISGSDSTCPPCATTRKAKNRAHQTAEHPAPTLLYNGRGLGGGGVVMVEPPCALWRARGVCLRWVRFVTTNTVRPRMPRRRDTR